MEVWELPVSQFGSFVEGIPAPLGIGRTVLADGRRQTADGRRQSGCRLRARGGGQQAFGAAYLRPALDECARGVRCAPFAMLLIAACARPL